jgi:membrane protease YdiL (CAAX protease family)
MNSTIDRKRIFIFVAIAYGIAIALALVIFLSGGLVSSDPYVATPLGTSLLYATMLSPAVANIATRLITREGWSNTLLRPNLRRGWRIYLAAWLLPLVAIIVGGAIYYLLFPSRFDLSMQWAREARLIPAPWATDPWTVVTSREVFYSLLYAPVAMFLMLGEEFGWRAYLLPKLMPLGPRRAILLVGAIWAVWHWPAIFLGYEYGFGYWGAPVVGPLLFVLVAMFMSAFYGWVTLRTGSVWPAAIGHAVNNSATLMMVFFLRGTWDRLIGPATVGIIGSLGYALLALLIFSSPRALAPTAGPRPVEPNN